ncbi:hypothetical protein NSK_006321 [Nannochloropsis salina CCMP1776]|uniref:Uncharacterized protein n=1 Tax=Nannochloropsis salina CCMP1776 TaxID=1027361 RepID=A0A4D9D113_9STRA|nr:hypothetical protein NSK_006321 [Nannochloropsis salina CCMP1776]|eukprot:TFJ82348.1 hypothetical protein NSK_006321 [Nannochloropsis salina CCMP1776]
MFNGKRVLKRGTPAQYLTDNVKGTALIDTRLTSSRRLWPPPLSGSRGFLTRSFPNRAQTPFSPLGGGPGVDRGIERGAAWGGRGGGSVRGLGSHGGVARSRGVRRQSPGDIGGNVGVRRNSGDSGRGDGTAWNEGRGGGDARGGGGGGGEKTRAGSGSERGVGGKATKILHQGGVMYEDLERVVMKQEAAENPETQRSLVSLARHVIAHPTTLEVVVELARSLVPRVLQSQETLDQVAVLLGKVIVEPPVKEAAVVLLTELVQDPEVYAAVVELSARLVAEPKVLTAVNELLLASSHKVLEDPQVVDHSKTFVAEVVADDALQRTGGTAIWNSFQYSFQPKLARVLWFGLLCGVVAFMRSGGRDDGLGANAFG